MVVPGSIPSLESRPSPVVEDIKPWEITPGMNLEEQSLRTAFDPMRAAPEYQGPPITKDLIAYLLKNYVEKLPKGQEPDDVLLGLANQILHPSPNNSVLEH